MLAGYEFFFNNKVILCEFIIQVTHWLNDRLKVASEEPSQELTNLRSKLTKHQAFEMELQANKQKIDSINEVINVSPHLLSTVF